MGEFHDFIYQGFKYKLFVPGKYKIEQKSPLMVMLHGCSQDPDDFAAGTNMNELAERENFLVLYPDMNHLLNPSDPSGYNPFGCWNWFLDKNQHRGQGHPRLIYEIIEEVKRGYSVDTKKIYAAGLSAGGSLACILGVTYPDVFSGIGICSGLPYDAANVFFLTDPMAEDAKKSMEKGVPDPYACGNSAFVEMGEFKKKMRVIVFHGICDTTVHPINGQQVIIQWAQTNFLIEGGQGNADVTPSLVNGGIINGKSYTQHVYSDENGESLMELWMVDDMGHVWSGGSSKGSYTDPLGPNASELIWSFFTQKQQHKNINLDKSKFKSLVKLPVAGSEQSSDHALVEGLAQSPEHPLVQAVGQPSEPSPAHSDEQPSELLSIELPPQPFESLSTNTQTQSVDTENMLPSKPESDEFVETGSEQGLKTQEKLPKEAHKKNLFFNLFSKLSKKKK